MRPLTTASKRRPSANAGAHNHIVTFKSPKTAFFLISAAGVVTVISVGRIEESDSSTVVLTTAGTGAHPREPAGMTMLYTHDGSSLLPKGWINSEGQVSIVSDRDKGNALQLAMTGMSTPGNGTARIDSDRSSFGATKLYVAFWEKVSPNFKGNNGAGQMKNVFLNMQQVYSGGPSTVLLALNNNPLDVNSRIRPSIEYYGLTNHDGRSFGTNNVNYYYPDARELGDPGDLFPRGTWHFTEVLWTANSRGNADGTVQMWIDGVSPLPSAMTDIYVNGLRGTGIKQVYDGVARFTDVTLTNTWGGGGMPISADNYYRFKDIYISGGFARPGERPDRWVLTPVEGRNPRAGTDVHIIAQLVDENGRPVDIYNPAPSFQVTGGATWSYWNGAPVYAAYVGGEHGQQLFTLHAGSTPGTVHVVTVDDYATVNNGARGDHRVGRAAITVR